MSRRKKEVSAFGKMFGPAVAAAVVVTLTTMNACTSDTGTESREESMSHNAAEAEAAEAKLSVAQMKPEAAAKAAKAAHGKVAKTDAKADGKDHSKKDAKVAKHDTKADKTHGAKDAHVATNKEPKTQKAARSVASAGGVFVVQVGAFKVKENADKLHAKLKDAGYTVEIQSIEHSKNGTLHLVRFAPYTSKAEAETVVEDLHAKQDLAAQVLALPSVH